MLCSGLTTQGWKIPSVTETPTRTLKENSTLGEDGSPAGDRIKHVGESRIHSETHEPIFFITTWSTVTTGIRNVTTMFEIEKAAKADADIRIYNLTVFETSKTRWTSPGQRRLATGELLLYSTGEDDAAPYTQRVALMLSFTAQRHSLDGRYTNQGVPRPLSKIRNGRSTWLSNHSLYPNK